MMRDHIVLFINGSRYEVGCDDALTTLTDFLRLRLGLVGTKIVCNEGDCGACSVLVGRPTDGGHNLRYLALDSCILFLFQLDRAHVVTVEGLRHDGQLSPVQNAMVQCHGSQCGYCTPGFVVAMHAMVEANETLDDDALRLGLSGNLCRCTGYSQILDAGKSVDPARVSRIRQIYPEQPILDQINSLGDGPVRMNGSQTIALPHTLDQAIELKAQDPSAIIVGGATDYGIEHNHGHQSPANLICLTNLEDYDSVHLEEGRLRIGGGATWTQIADHVESLFPPYHQIITRFGSPQIRNAGTLAGNLATGSSIADSIPFHMVMNSEICLISPRGRRQVKLDEFYTGYRENLMADDELIAEVSTPLLAGNEKLALYKISKRRDMDISTLTLGLWIHSNGNVIEDARLAIGGVGPTVTRITAAEACLIGSPHTESTFRTAGEIAKKSISPWSDVRGSSEYRLQLTENLLQKAYHEFNEPIPEPAGA